MVDRRHCGKWTAWLVLVGVFGIGSLPAAEFFVATDGNDQWSGRLPAPNGDRTDGPFATLVRARDAVRQLGAPASRTESVTVHIRGGFHELPQGIRLDAQDSGTAERPVEYRAYQREKPVLLGGRTLRSFTPHSGEILKLDLTAAGLPKASFRQLLFRGDRQHLARFPNFDPGNPYGGGWAYADGKAVPMYVDIPDEPKNRFQFRAEDGRPFEETTEESTEESTTEQEVLVFPRYNWWNNIVRVKGVDRGTRTVTLVADCSYPIRPGDRYFVQNSLRELDAPGEWFLDRRTNTVYFWPPSPLGNLPVHVPTTRTILELGRGVEHVTWRGLTFACCEGTAVVLNDTKSCVIAGCTVRAVGDYHGSGVSIQGGSRNGVVGCDIFQTGSHGISISGGDRMTLTAAENYADNNYIHHVGVFYKQGVGIHLNGVGNRATHNLIHDGPRMGIMFAGNNLLLEYNHIRHVNLETEDTGAVYTGGRDWLGSRGTVIRHNFFHDILGYGKDEQGKWVSPHFAWGVYLDDNTGGVDVIGNVVARCSRAGLHLHNGRDNRIENNIFVDGGQQQFEYSGWTAQHRFWTSHFPTMVQGYESVAGQPAWRAMRNMGTHPRDAILPDGTIMSGNEFRRNIVRWSKSETPLVRFGNVSPTHQVVDGNFYWNGGHPIRTGQSRAGRDLGKNLAPNPSFELGEPGGMPRDWQWQIRPLPQAVAGITRAETTAGKQVLRMAAAFNAEKPRDNYPIVVSREIELAPGTSYRLRGKFRAMGGESVAAMLMVQGYEANAFFWGSYPNAVTAGPEWREHEFVFRIPGPSERGYHERMGKFRVRVDLPGKSGVLEADDLALHRVEMLDEFAAWQELGYDRQSLVADPQFVAPEQDDFRLRPDSPALKGGFQPIPWEKIGPYQDDSRASWPIEEAAGAREHPLNPA